MTPTRTESVREGKRRRARQIKQRRERVPPGHPYDWQTESEWTTHTSWSRQAIRDRAKSSDPRWAHYERAPAHEVGEGWPHRVRWAYRLRPGTSWDPLTLED